jgi:hypothetical protein
MNEEKLRFLKENFVPLLRKLAPGQKGEWGKMDAQQMVEHFRETLKWANGKVQLPLFNPDPERLQKVRNFIMTEIEFKENTKSPALGEEPAPHKFSSLQEAVNKLEIELKDMFTAYEKEAGTQLINPIFGDLDYTQQVQLIYKHALHHLKQFGLV